MGGLPPNSSIFSRYTLYFILMKTNEHEVDELLQLAKKIGANEVTLRYFIFRQYDQVLLKFLLDKYRTETKEYTIYDSCNGITDYKRTIDSSVGSFIQAPQCVGMEMSSPIAMMLMRKFI